MPETQEVVEEQIEESQDTADELAGLSDEELTKLAEAQEPEDSDVEPEPERKTEPKSEKPESKEGAESQEQVVSEAPKTLEEALARLKEREEAEAKLKKQVDDKEAFIQRQSQEIGLYRKQVTQPGQQAAQPTAQQAQNFVGQMTPEQAAEAAKELGITEEQYFLNPVASNIRITQHVINKMVEQQARQQVEQETHMEMADLQTRNTVYERAPDFDSVKPEIEKILKADGYPDEEVAFYMQNPFKFNPLLTVNLVHRAKESVARAALEAELAKIKENGNPDKIAASIARAANGKTAMTKAPAAKSRGTMPDVSDDQIARMSDDALKSALEESLRSEG